MGRWVLPFTKECGGGAAWGRKDTFAFVESELLLRLLSENNKWLEKADPPKKLGVICIGVLF